MIRSLGYLLGFCDSNYVHSLQLKRDKRQLEDQLNIYALLLSIRLRNNPHTRLGDCNDIIDLMIDLMLKLNLYSVDITPTLSLTLTNGTAQIEGLSYE